MPVGFRLSISKAEVEVARDEICFYDAVHARPKKPTGGKSSYVGGAKQLG